MKSMKWYFASRVRHRDFIEKVSEILKSNGYIIAYEWTKEDPLKPYKENSEEYSSVAGEIIKSLEDVDVFVLISDESEADMLIELGTVLRNENTKIYIVGKYNDSSLMNFHPKIKRVDNLIDVFSVESPDVLTEENIEFLNSFEI